MFLSEDAETNMTPLFYGNADASVILLQMTDTHEEPNLPREFELICKSCPDEKLFLAAIRVDNWNDDLSPWPAPPVFGKEAFGGRAAQTLATLQTDILPLVREKLAAQGDARFLIGGYSLAALFALYACCETDTFAACAAASPSVWFPGWLDYARQHTMYPQTIYLSLGDREPCAKNSTMARVGNCIEAQARLLAGAGKTTTLAWEHGGHFKDSDQRMARAFAWCIQHI